MHSDTRPDPVQDDPPVITGKIVRQQRDKPDWITFRGYAGIALGMLIAFFVTARAAGAAQLIFILIWIAGLAAVRSFTKYDRHRRITGKEK